jgi:hypothetical protein
VHVFFFVFVFLNLVLIFSLNFCGSMYILSGVLKALAVSISACACGCVGGFVLVCVRVCVPLKILNFACVSHCVKFEVLLI